MPWYIWLLIAFVLGSVIAGLLVLRDMAKKIPQPSAEELERMKARNAELEAQEKDR